MFSQLPGTPLTSNSFLFRRTMSVVNLRDRSPYGFLSDFINPLNPRKRVL